MKSFQAPAKFVVKLIKQLGGRKIPTVWAKEVSESLEKNWDSLTPSDFEPLLERRDLPDVVQHWLQEVYADFLPSYIRRSYPLVRTAEKLARKIEFPKSWVSDIKELGRQKIKIATKRDLINIGEALEQMQAKRDRLTEMRLHLDKINAPLQAAVDLASRSLWGSHFNLSNTDAGKREFIKHILKRCSAKADIIKYYETLINRAQKNLDNNYYSVKLAVDASDRRRYQTGFVQSV